MFYFMKCFWANLLSMVIFFRYFYYYNYHCYFLFYYFLFIFYLFFLGCDEDELFWSICNEVAFFPKFLTKESKHLIQLVRKRQSIWFLSGRCNYLKLHKNTYHLLRSIWQLYYYSSFWIEEIYNFLKSVDSNFTLALTKTLTGQCIFK